MFKIGNRFLDRIMFLTLDKKIKWKVEICKNKIRYRGISNYHIFIINVKEDNIYCMFNQLNLLTTESNWEQIFVKEDILRFFQTKIKEIMFNKYIVKHKGYFIDTLTGEILYKIEKGNSKNEKNNFIFKKIKRKKTGKNTGKVVQ